MIEHWNRTAIGLGDRLFGRVLSWGPDAVLLIVVAFSVALLLVVRKLATNQALLATIREDERTQRMLRRNSRAMNDRGALARYRFVRMRVARLRLREELRAAVLAILPLALVLTWAAERLKWHVPNPADPIELRVVLPRVWNGEVLHVVPMDNVRPVDGWVRVARIEQVGSMTHAVASWQLVGPASGADLPLVVRFRERSLRHLWRTGTFNLLPPRIEQDDQIVSEIKLKVYRPFGISPDTGPWGIPPWLLVHLLLTMAAFSAMRRMLRIY